MPRSSVAEQPSGDLLNSWKEIAAFFGKDVRTVRRWEAERGLPVHRVPGGERSGVFAYASELKDWLHETGRADAVLNLAVPEAAVAAETLQEPAPTRDGPEAGAAPRSPDQPGFEDESGIDQRPGHRRWLSFLRRYEIILMATAAVLLCGVVLLGPKRPLASRTNRIVETAHAPSVRRSSNPEAQDLYLRGRYLWSLRTQTSLTQAVDLFTQAIVHDPRFAPAYAGLADSYILLRQYGQMADADAFPRALAADRQALSLDDASPEAHRTYAFLVNYWLWNFPVADKEFQRAIALKPDDAQAHQWYATSLYTAGRFQQALSEIDIARSLEPGSISILANRGLLLAAVDLDAARAYLLQVEAANPNFASVHTDLAIVSMRQADYPAFLEESRHAAQISGDTAGMEVLQAASHALASRGDKAMLFALEAGYGKLAEQGTHDAMDPASFAMQAGDREQALHYLALACRLHQAGFLRVDRDPVYRPLQDNAEFQLLVRRRNTPVDPVSAVGSVTLSHLWCK